MKHIFACILILAFGVQNLYATGVTAWYYLNRSAIAKTLCVNRNRPELKCHGSCQLKKKLQEAETNTENIPDRLKEWPPISPSLPEEQLILKHNSIPPKPLSLNPSPFPSEGFPQSVHRPPDQLADSLIR